MLNRLRLGYDGTTCNPNAFERFGFRQQFWKQTAEVYRTYYLFSSDSLGPAVSALAGLDGADAPYQCKRDCLGSRLCSLCCKRSVLELCHCGKMACSCEQDVWSLEPP